jgi:CheY-like chemotaxis protein
MGSILCDFDEDRHESNIQGLKAIVNADGCKLAFMKYLNRIGSEDLFNYYYELGEILEKPPEEIISASSSLFERYCTSRIGKNRRFHEKTMSLCSDILKNIQHIDREELYGKIHIVQSHMFALMADLYLDDFLNSPEYHEWNTMQLKFERLNYMHKPSRNTTEEKSDHRERLSDTYKKVLIVDDSAVVAKLCGAMLKKKGHEVDIAYNGRQALDMVNEKSYNLIVIDMHMPILSGFDVLKTLRHTQTGYARMEIRIGSSFKVVPSGTIIIGMSADCNKETSLKAIRCGVDGFITKPLHYQDIVTICRKYY